MSLGGAAIRPRASLSAGLVLVACLMMLSVSAVAESQSVLLSNKSFVEIFQSAAFSNKKEVSFTHALNSVGITRIGRALELSWLRDSAGVIQKWPDEIVIAVYDGDVLEHDKEDVKKKIVEVKTTIEAISPRFERITDINITIRHSPFEINQGSEFNVGVSLSRFHDDNKFRHRAHEVQSSELHKPDAERIVRETRFSPQNEYGVEGFVRSDEMHNIRYGKCDIWHGHNIDVIRRLTVECIVRVLGLTGSVDDNNSILRKKSIQQESVASEGTFIEEIDLQMIETLYDSRLKPGMSPSETTKVLNQILSD